MVVAEDFQGALSHLLDDVSLEEFELVEYLPGAPLVARLGAAGCLREGCERKAPRHRFGDRVIPGLCAKHEAESDARLLEEERLERLAVLLRDAGQTPMMADWSLGTYPSDDVGGRAALLVAKRWLRAFESEEQTPNLLLTGKIGAGKTGLAWGLVREVCELGVRARFENFPDLLDRMKEAFRSNAAGALLEQAASVPVLALDDVGAERITAWTLGELLSLVDRRYQRMLPTIFTLNYSTDEFVEAVAAARFDRVTAQRIVSRMQHRSVAHQFRGVDRRDKGEAA